MPLCFYEKPPLVSVFANSFPGNYAVSQHQTTVALDCVWEHLSFIPADFVHPWARCVLRQLLLHFTPFQLKKGFTGKLCFRRAGKPVSESRSSDARATALNPYSRLPHHQGPCPGSWAQMRVPPLPLGSPGVGELNSCMCVLVSQSCPTLCHPMDYTPPGSSVHGVLQARILEWVAIPFSRGSLLPRDRT